jgi:deazaflavin-dependent oxidoreductase (nitroreductase family)
MQFLRLRWGRVVEDRLYEDTQRLVEALAYLAERGNGEAGAPPLSAAGVPDDTGARRAGQAGRETKNPFTSSATGGRVLSALQLPLFAVRPPRGYGILTTTGRKTGKTRRRCIRAVRRGDRAYIVAIKGARTAWLRNAQANPRIRLRVRGATLDGIARDPRGESESREAMEAYCHEVGWFAHLEYAMWRSDRPTSAKIRELHRSWFQRGHPLVVELESGHDAAR